MQPENGIPISSYFYDPADTELRCLAKYLLDKLAHVPDIRKVNSQEFNLQNIIDLAMQTQMASQSNQQENLSPRSSAQYLQHMQSAKEDHRQRLAAGQ